MKKTIALLQDGFASSSTLTPEFAAYAKMFRHELKKRLVEIDAELVSFNRGHFYVSGFFKKGEQMYYFSQDDVRWGNTERVLVRTAKHDKDFTGGTNNWDVLGADLFERLPQA